MSHKNQTNSYTEFFYKAFRNTLIIGIPLVIISAIVLSSLHISATRSGSGTDSLTISISSACTLSSTVNTEHSDNVKAGTYKDDIGKTTIKTTCNDNNGYSIYANGYSNNKEGNNRLINTLSSSNVIETGLNTSGDTSSWAMKLNNLPDDPSPTPPVIESAYDDTYGLVPNNWTKVLSLPSGSTDMSLGSSFTTTYAVYANSRQYTGTYQGQVKFLLTHPYSTDEHIYYMQEVDAWKNTLALEQSVQAIDKRDGKSYWVTRLADGNVWMTQNLDLCIGCEGVATLTSENTDINPEASGKGIYNAAGGYSESGGVWTWAPANAAITSSINVNYNTNKAAGWDIQNSAPRSAEGGGAYFYTSGSTSNDKKYDSLGLCKVDHPEVDCLHYHVGNYYNWTAAIASNASSGISTDKIRADNSICPRGWRLPNTDTTDSIYNEFGRLLYIYNITNSKANTTGSVGYKTGGFNALRTSSLWFVRSGYLYNGSLYDSAIYGNYWSNTVNNDSRAYGLYFDSSNIYPANYGSRSTGRSIRCIAR